MAITDTLRKVPTWGWLLVGGAGLGIGYSFYRDRRNPDGLEGSAGEESLTAGLGEEDYYYGGSQPAPIGVISAPAPYSETGQVGAIGQTAFETLVDAITGIYESVPAIIEAARPDPIEATPLPAAPPPDYSGSPITAPPAPSPAPAPAPTPVQPTSVTILGRRFSGAYRYTEIATPNLRSRDFNVYWHKPHLDERWRRSPDGTWRKIAEGNFGG